MTDVHKIRLRGPWQMTPLARTFLRDDSSRRRTTEDLPGSVRGKVGCDWGQFFGEGWLGEVSYRRIFRCPTQLDENQKVLLVIEAVDFFGRVKLNGSEVGEFTLLTSPFRIEITSRLLEKNELVVEVDLPDERTAGGATLDRADRVGRAGGLVGEVSLEIWG